MEQLKPCPFCGNNKPVKPEDVTGGWYWLVAPNGRRWVDQILFGYPVGSDDHVKDLFKKGFTFYRIPELPDLEVSE